MIRAVAYPRYSSDNQREESIHAQMRAIEEYCNKQGYTLVGSYPDEEKSGKSDNRPAFQRMIEDAKRGMFDVVVVHKLDRFARNRYDSAHYKRILKLHGVRLESVLERLDGSPESIMSESIYEGMAEYFSLNLAREARKGLLENARAAKHTGGQPPYGLKVNPSTMQLEIDERTAGAVRIYFDGIESNMKNEDIASKLNELGYRTQGGRHFNKNSFFGWARNRKYKGDYVYDRAAPRDMSGKRTAARRKAIEDVTIIEDVIPAIISKEQWERVNEIMDRRKHKPGEVKAMAIYLLSGKIYCENCGAPYAANSYKNGDKGRQYYYRCSNKCGNAQVRKDDIEQIAVKYLLDEVFCPEGVDLLVARVQEMYQLKRSKGFNQEQSIRDELADIDKKLANYVQAIGNGIMAVIEPMKVLEQRKANLKYTLIQIAALHHYDKLDDAEIRRRLAEKKNALESAPSQEELKDILQEYINKILIREDSAVDNILADVSYRVYKSAAKSYLVRTLTINYDKRSIKGCLKKGHFVIIHSGYYERNL